MKPALRRVVGTRASHRTWTRASTLLWGLLEFVALQRARYGDRRHGSYLQLRGHGFPRHGLTPCCLRAFAGALIPARARIQCWVPACAGTTKSNKSALPERIRPERMGLFCAGSVAGQGCTAVKEM